MNYGFFRVASVSTPVTVADPMANAHNIIETFATLAQHDVDMAVYPEMSVPAYTCGDLFHNRLLLDGVAEAVDIIKQSSVDAPGTLIIVGAPYEYNNSLYNCSIAICNGEIVAIVPKSYIPNYNEFYEKRWFSPADATLSDKCFGPAIISHKGVNVGIEICEDLWTPIPPSCHLAMDGAEVIANLSASDDITGKYDYLRTLVMQQSARCICAYAYSSAGFGESSTDLVFDAKLFVAENGKMLAKNQRWCADTQIIMADVDIEAIRRDRMHNGSFDACRRNNAATFTRCRHKCDKPSGSGLATHARGRPAPLRALRLGHTCRPLRGNCQHTGRRPCQATRRHSLQKPRNRCVGRPRLYPGSPHCRQDVRPSRPRPPRHHGCYHARLRHHRPHAQQCMHPYGSLGRDVARNINRRRRKSAFRRHRPRPGRARRDL